MPDATESLTGPLRPTAASHLKLRPASAATVTGGLWADRRRINREVSVPAAWDRLHEAGNFHNLELAAGSTGGDYVNDLPFLDSDLYKWLEAIGWTLADPELGADAAAQLERFIVASTELLDAAQAPDGYLDSHFQVRFPGERFVQLPWGHELYCAGHLIQAAIALHRTSDDTRLLDIARRCADLVVTSFGSTEDQIDGVCGHPEIETALVELYRETGEIGYLDTARFFVDRRGNGLLGDCRFGPQYWQDHAPVREADSVAGHAVRQLYLLAGVADVYAETGDETLREASERLWTQLVAEQTYLTGGSGAHHTDEAFGDPYELPNERSYCETCAAIASIMFSWRMLMITGEARYADLMERTLHNGFLAGISPDGQRYIYANPLQVRDDHVSGGNDQDYERRPWFYCACCPPNVMRTFASLEHYVALAGENEIVLHQYVPGRYEVQVGSGPVTIEVETDYPWNGTVRIRLAEVPGDEFGVTMRVPHWAAAATLTVNGSAVPAGDASADGWWRVERGWTVGDELVLELPLDVRFTSADPRVDADRGCVAIERGPLVYCIESADNPGRLDDVRVDPTLPAEPVEAPDPSTRTELDVVPIRVGGTRPHRDDTSWWPYGSVQTGAGDPISLTAIPYFAWGNRGPGAMRIWIPTT